MPELEQSRPSNSRKKRLKNARFGAPRHSKESSKCLLTDAASLLISAQPELALLKAKKALRLSRASSESNCCSLPVLHLLGEISIQLGDHEAAQSYFMDAVSLDPDGRVSDETGDGSSKFFWLAQLSDEGGANSVRWFERGADILRREIAEANKWRTSLEAQSLLEVKKSKLANALCGMAEVYMTDLSWEMDAESRSEAYVTEALLIAPHAPEPLQTLASVRISQERWEEARSALTKSLQLWQHFSPEDPNVPEFSSRISLSRLLMEADMRVEAMKVLERLVLEDSCSVEAWYLGGLCLYIDTNKYNEVHDSQSGETCSVDVTHSCKDSLRQSRKWLLTCLDLYRSNTYEDGRMKEHVEQLLSQIKAIIGEVDEEGNDDTDAAWEDEDETDNVKNDE